MSVIFGPGIGMQPAQGSLVADTNPVDQAPIVVQATDTQSGNLMEFRSPSGALLSAVDVNGAIGGGAGLAGAVILAPGSATRNTIQPTADANRALALKRHSATQTGLMLDVQDETGVSLASFSRSGGLSIALAEDDFPLSVSQVPAGTNNVAMFNIFDAGGHRSIFEILNDLELQWELIDSAGTRQFTAGLQPGFLSNNPATPRGRLDLFAWDETFSKRVFVRGEADGSAPRIGFLGAPAVVRQTNGTAADLAAIADAPAKAFITALSTALVNLGLLAAPA